MLLRAGALVLAATNAGTACAASAPPFADLLKQSLPNAPRLLEQAANVRAAQAEARQARARPNPTVDANLENLAAPKDPGGITQRQQTYTVTQPFEFFGKRSARIAVGERGIEAARARGQQAEIEFAAELAVLYASAEAAQARLTLAEEDLGRASEDLRAVRALVRAGKEATLREAQANASLAAATADREAAIADNSEALERLSALAGVAESFSSVPPSLLAAAPAPIVGPVSGESPAVAAAAAEQRALAAQVRVEQTRALPNIGVSAGLRRYEGVRDSGLVVGVSASIPLFDRNVGGIQAARERAAAAQARLDATRLAANADRRAALAQATASVGRLQAASQGEAAAGEAYRLARIGYDAGKTSLIELLVIRRALNDARESTINARLARVQALAALARAEGRIAFGA